MKKTFCATLAITAVLLFTGNIFAQEKETGQEVMTTVQKQIKASMDSLKLIKERKAVLNDELAKEVKKEVLRKLIENYILAVQNKNEALLVHTVNTALDVNLDKNIKGAFMMFVDNYNAGIKFDTEKFVDIMIDSDLTRNYCSLQKYDIQGLTRKYAKELMIIEIDVENVIGKVLKDKLTMCQVDFIIREINISNSLPKGAVSFPGK